VQLVFLFFEMKEEAAHSGKSAFAFHDEFLLLGIEVNPRHVERNVGLPGEALEFGEQGPVLGLGPRLDSALVQGKSLVGDNEVEIEINGVAKPWQRGQAP